MLTKIFEQKCKESSKSLLRTVSMTTHMTYNNRRMWAAEVKANSHFHYSCIDSQMDALLKKEGSVTGCDPT